HESMMEAGRLGRKTNAGFYDYDENGQIIRPELKAIPSVEPAKRAYLPEPIPSIEPLLRDLGISILAVDDGIAPILAAPVGEDCTSLAHRLNIDATRLVAIDMLTGVHLHATVMAAPGANNEVVESVMAALQKITNTVTRIKDCPGFVAQRIRAMVANLGCEMAQIGVATPEDIDKGMKLGLNYPLGSIELAEHMGANNTYTILSQIQRITGEERYRPSQWLRRRALLNLPIHTLD
ncbi:MAG: hypothetical protein JKY04_05775, partial [Sneathiella sp.]|nr:hypothetical protein [Sneathiella sp.]